MIGITGAVTGQHYGWVQEAFARRCIATLDTRNIKSVTELIAATSSIQFTAAGFLLIKKILAEVIGGSIAFPNDLSADGTAYLPGITDTVIGTRDISSTIT